MGCASPFRHPDDRPFRHPDDRREEWILIADPIALKIGFANDGSAHLTCTICVSKSQLDIVKS